MHPVVFSTFLIVIIASTSPVNSYDYCEYPLVDYKVSISASSQLQGRGAENARIDSGSAWTAGSSDFEQWLLIDLKTPRNITGIASRGRSHSKEFVREYVISYGFNGLDFSEYKENDGSRKLFKGNHNGDSTHTNVFETPIIAQYIRINPTRWQERIAMRVELYGCDYVAETIAFNGNSMVWKNLTYFPIQSFRDSIKFRFRTSDPNGIVMYSRGTQGDFFALQVVENRMMLNINLGSSIMTSITAGSLLDDSIWHDVSIIREGNIVSFVVDRVEIKEVVKGDFQRLDLDRMLYIGGVPHLQEGLIIAKNFSGCMENVFLNDTNVIRELKEPKTYWDERTWFYKNNTVYQCGDSSVVPITFLSPKSYIKLKGYEGVRSLNASFEFRSYEPAGLLMYHKLLSVNSYLKVYLDKKRIWVELQTDKTPRIQMDNFPNREFNDGQWHKVIITAGRNLITLTVDEVVINTIRVLNIDTGGYYWFGGGAVDTSGFIGCMRQISIDGNFRPPGDFKDDELCCRDDPVILNACQMTDRCSPNPCEHGGKCTQTSEHFQCICEGTGYAGSVCHMSQYPISCQAVRNIHGNSQKTEVMIDPDGSGPLKALYVTCEYFREGTTKTVVRHSHDSEPYTVTGYSEPGSFQQEIMYDGTMEQIEAILNRSSSCTQFIKYECTNSKLFNSPLPATGIFQPSSWWVSRRNLDMDYWGDSIPGSRKCECGIMNNCVAPDKWCNCDAGFPNTTSDEGQIREMEYLPIRRIHVGDTGTPLDDKMARFTVGPLMCEGDALFDNVVTFRLPDAVLVFPLPDFSHSWDIYFEFKTTTTSTAVLLHSVGKTGDYIKVSLLNGYKIQFQIESGSGPLTATTDSSSKLNDNEWHSVHIEKNRKEARVVVDGSSPATAPQPAGQVRTINLESRDPNDLSKKRKELFLGATADRKSGFVGCIRALTVNGDMLDFKEALRGNSYGLGTGCSGKCDSGPCLNNGTCYEGYDRYTCDCRFTAFKGPICADEIGVNLQSNEYIAYEFRGSYKSTIAEKLRVGFTTTDPKGFLVGLFSNISGEYLTLQVSNSGHLRLIFDFGFERQEIIFPDQNFATGQYHDVQISRQDSGTKLVMKVDNFPPLEKTFPVKTSADAQFNNIQYMFIGKNESVREGFIGCISRVEFDDLYPLKYYFQENRPINVWSKPANINEDFCGVEPVTHPPDVHEVPPNPELNREDYRRATSYKLTTIILAVLLGLIFLGIVIFMLLIGRFLARHKGEYLTQEDEGAYGAADPNEAVVDGVTGHNVTKKKEWFI